jgi:lysophospholipase L1-like esterase
MTTTRLVCVGDSFTEGLCDDLRPDGEYLGWADRVAAALARDRGGLEYANLAVRGKLLDQVVTGQLPLADDLRPDVLTFHAGGNDVLRRGTDLPHLFARYDATLAGICDGGRRVLVFTCLTRAGGTGRLADAIAERFTAFNDNVRASADRHGAIVIDLEAAHALTDRRLWYTDRLHLNPAGHARVAAAVLERLGVTEPDLLGGPVGWWRQPLPPGTANRRRDDLRADLAWARDHFAPWVWRRVRGVSSGDGRVAKDAALRGIG